jgi:predicted N-formylglutamate amidohydrolase
MPGETFAFDGDSRAFNDHSLVITCEHGGNQIPKPYQALFHDPALLDSHRGFDPGALSMARTLATAYAAPLVSATISRLLVDLNRSVGNPSLHAEAIRKLPAEMREQILIQYYQPYRAQAEQLVRQTIAEDGKVRHADIGLLFDPIRPGETQLCKNWQAALKVCAPELIVRRNYPYAGKGDGLTAWFRRQLSPAVYVGIELEINKKHIVGADRHWTALRKVIVQSLGKVLADDYTALNAKNLHESIHKQSPKPAAGQTEGTPI